MTYEHRQVAVAPGISLETRITSGGSATPVICIPGLTRNAADFGDLAEKIAKTGRDVAAVSLRGRGKSDPDPEHANYFPTTYRDDVLKILDALSWKRAIFVGTSLGGLTTLLTAEAAPDRVAAAVINDIGPELAQEGIDRIAEYVNKTPSPAASIDEAAERIRHINGVAFPEEKDGQFWRDFASRTFRESPDGWVLNYDPAIGAALVENGPGPDLWPAWKKLRETPTLLVHGEISDLLTDEIVEKMRVAHPKCDYVRVPRVGHAPFLTEPAAWDAIEAFLGQNRLGPNRQSSAQTALV